MTYDIEIQTFQSEIKQELSDLLSWWDNHLTDEENGGFYGSIGGQGKLQPKTEKGVILNTRILWTFASAGLHSDNSVYTKIAKRAFDYIIENFIDEKNGGVYWMLDHKGNRVNTKKQIYAQGFAIYAFSEYHRLTGNERAKSLAISIFELIENYSLDKKNDGYLEAFSEDWQLLDDLRLSTKDANEAKTMNTHLHILEAYTNLYRIEKSEAVRKALKGLIECFLEKFIDPKTYHLRLFFDENWTLKSNEISYGHDIECSWLLHEAAEVLGDEKLLKRIVKCCIEMAKVTLNEGVGEDGSVFNELKDNHLDKTKIWWVQAEAMVGFWNAYQLTQDTRFKNATFNCWKIVKKYLKDPQNGEWYWCVDENGKPDFSHNKAGPWKAPYHNGRMCLEIGFMRTIEQA